VTVLVVGAGVAGLTAARALQDRNHRVVVVERARRPGGRLATRRIIDAALAAGRTAAMFVANKAEKDEFAALGVSWFVLGSDQSLLRQAAQAVANPASARHNAN